MVTEQQEFICPCGCGRKLTGKARAVFPLVRAIAGTQVLIATAAGTWWVPRLYLAIHSLAEADLPELAQRHGWPQVP